jgi:capsular polysaccharide biosynthesis protein
MDHVAIGGLHEPVFDVVADLDGLARPASPVRLTLFGPTLPPAQLPAWDESALPQPFLAEHRGFIPPSGVHVYAVPDARLWGNGLVTRGDRFVAPADVMPAYLLPQLAAVPHKLPPMHAGPVGRADAELLACDLPLLSALHPNLHYPRFLLEMLPRLWVATMLRAYGVRFRFALPGNLLAWAGAFVRLLGLDEDALVYDAYRQCVTAPSMLLPSMLHRDYSFHPAINLAVEALVTRAGPPPSGAPTHLFLRRSPMAPRRIDNEAELEQVMARAGFAVVDSHRMPLADRLRLLAGARVVAGEYGAALHDVMFAPIGTRIIAINFATDYQSKMARVRQQRIAYVAPSDGLFRHWRLNRGASETFSVDPATLRACVRGMAPELG